MRDGEGAGMPDVRLQFRSPSSARKALRSARESFECQGSLVPVIRLSGRTTKANIAMDAGLLAVVDATARQRGLTRSAFLADLARR